MILINLLPQELRPIKRTPVPYILSVGALIGAVLIMAMMFLASFTKERSLRSELATAEADLKALENVVNEYNALTQKKVLLKDKIETIQEILSDRKIWSEHLHKLASLTPENIWYNRIRVYSVTQQVFRDKIDPTTNQKVIDPTTKLPQTERVSINVPMLEVSGFVINDETGVAQVAPLSDATSNDPEFSKHFKFDNLLNMKYTTFKTFSVRSFTLQYKIMVDTGLETAS